MPYTTFLSGPDWECSSEPILIRKAVTDNLWPEGGAKDTLTAGEHPFLAFGVVADRPFNVVGVVVEYDAATDQAMLNIAPGYIAKAPVCNITGYDGGVANAWAANLAAYDPVFIDDSAEIAAGVTLSRSPTNSAAAQNPMAGYVWPDQDEWDDSGVGGVDGDNFPIDFDTSTDEAYLTVCVMLWPSPQD